MADAKPPPSTTDCPPESAFVDLLEGRISGDDAARLRRHAEGCDACRALLEEVMARTTATIDTPPDQVATDDALARAMLRNGDAMATLVGTTLDRKYELCRLLGGGGMGAVFESRHAGTGRRVAVKLINARLVAGGEVARRRFRREAKAAGSLDSPHVVAVLDAGEDGASGDLYLVMELLHGRDLQRLIDDVGPLQPDVALRIAAQALAGLAKAHEAGVVHRDVKPANLFVARGDDGAVTVKVLDFGIAKITAEVLHGAETTGLTHAGGILGSPLYMSPEQAQSSKDVDARADVWSLGSTLYAALAGQAPFAHVDSIGKLIVAICGTPTPPLRGRAPWVAPEVAEVVHRALAIDREKRWPSAGAMLEALRALLPDGVALREEALAGMPPELRATAEPPPSSQRITSEPAPLAPPAPRSRPRARLLVGAGVAAAAAAATVGALLAFAPGRDPPPPAGNPRRVTSGASWAVEPAISPDGKLVAYVSDEKGNPDIWVVDARGGAPRALTDDPAEDRTPAWFPDGSAIAFASDRGGADAIWKVPVAGGPATQIVPGLDPAISPDGTRIAFVRPDDSGRYFVWVAPLADPGQAKEVTGAHDGLWENRHPAWSPDGATLAYQDHANVWTVPADGGSARRLTSGNDGDRWPSFAPDGRHLYFSSGREETVALWRLSTDDGHLVRLTLGTGPEVEPFVSRDGARLAYSTYAEDRALVIVDLAKGTQARMPDVIDFGLAPDGSEVVYDTPRKGHSAVFAQALEQRAPRGAPQPLADLDGTLARPSFSPDGRWIAAHRVLEGRRDIWILPAAGGAPERITSDGAMHLQPVWSPDGASLAFLSDRSGSYQVWTVPVAGGRAAGEARQITFDFVGKSMPTWSPRGDEIAYVADAGGGHEIGIVPVAGGAPRLLTTGANVFCIRWDRASGAIYASGSWGGAHKSLRRVSPSTGEAKPLDPEVSFGNVAAGAFDVSLDGSTLAIRHEEARGDVWVLDAPKGSRY